MQGSIPIHFLFSTPNFMFFIIDVITKQGKRKIPESLIESGFLV